jgi:hypothetical protein
VGQYRKNINETRVTDFGALQAGGHMVADALLENEINGIDFHFITLLLITISK